MVTYTVYIIHGARCSVCKRWIKETYSKKPEFENDIKCCCTTTFTAKQLINEMNAKIKIKEFDSDKLFQHMVQQYLKKNNTLDHANSMACMIVAREKAAFERKYGFINEQKPSI